MGYVAQHLASQLPNTPYLGTSRSTNFDSLSPEIMDQFDHFLISIPPNDSGDITLQYYGDYFKSRTKPISWIGYLSTTGVYGDHHGNWVTEDTPAIPLTQRSKNRLLAEQQWLTLSHPVKIYRLSGIYGPGKSALDAILAGKAKLINKPGHYFNRIHVDDICQILLNSMNSDESLFNLADDRPCSLVDVYRYAYQLLNQVVPEPVNLDSIELSPMLREFYSENKRINNDRINNILTQGLLYPSYNEGLQQCLKHLRKST